MAFDKFWPLIIPGHRGNTSFENNSVDVELKNCFNDYDTTACVRNTLLSFVGFGTLFLCIIRIMKLHFLHHPQIHQYLVFYFASLEVMFLTIKWIILSRFYQLEFVANYLKLIQFILLCHFHWSLVSRILHNKKMLSWCIMPILCGFFGFINAVTVMALLSHFSSWDECLAPHWLLLAIVEFLGTVMYLVAGIYITKKINNISALDSFKWEQKRDLWGVISTYAFSSLSSLVYYLTLQALGTFESGCSGIFNHTQEIYSPVYAIYMVIKYLIPIWVMLLVFFPTRGFMSSEDERLLGWSISGSTTSIFTPIARYQESYRQLILPVDYGYPEENSPLRRSFSSPAVFASSPLSPISEEADVYHPTPPPRFQYDNYGATDSSPSQAAYVEPLVRSSARVRTRHKSGHPSKQKDPRGRKILVSLNQGPDETESVTPSSGERA